MAGQSFAEWSGGNQSVAPTTPSTSPTSAPKGQSFQQWSGGTPLPSSKPMVFTVGEGLNPAQQSAAQDVLSKEVIPVGQTIKAPFIQTGITVPNGPVEDITKSLVEFPEKSFRSLSYLAGLDKQTQDRRGNQTFQVPSYAEVAGKTTGELIDEGFKPWQAVALSSAQTAGQFANDALMYLDPFAGEGGALKSTILDDALLKTKTTIRTPESTKFFNTNEVKDIWQTGKVLSEAEKNNILQVIGGDSVKIKEAIKNGISIKVPSSTIIKLEDKPYWAKIKGFFGVEPATTKFIRQDIGIPVQTVRGYLNEGAPVAPTIPDVAPLPEAPVSAPTPTPEGIPTTPTAAEALANAEAKIPKPDPLIEEAKKYQSVEEYINKIKGKEKIDSSFKRGNIDTVYHNTSPQTARNIVFADTVNDGLNVSTLPELALGQGGKGVTIEFDTRRLNGGKIQKPGADFIEANEGKYPEYELRGVPSKLTPDVKSVTFDKPLSQRGEVEFFGYQQNWKATKEVLPDGRVKYTNPNYKTKSQLTDIWKKANEAPAARPVEAAAGETPIIEGVVAKASADINKRLVQAGFKELPQEELAKFTPQKKDEVITRVTDLMTKDIETAKKMALGEVEVSDSIKQTVFNAVKNWAFENNDYNLLAELAKSPVSIERSLAAQSLGAAGFNNDPFDIVQTIESINKERELKTAKVHGNKQKALVKKGTAVVKTAEMKLAEAQALLDSLIC